MAEQEPQNTYKKGTCTDKDPFDQCPCAQRIKLILTRYDTIVLTKAPKSDETLQQETHQLVHEHVAGANYNNVELLNDTYHLKYAHKTISDSDQFQAFYNFLHGDEQVLQCDINDCRSVKRYYSHRRRSGKQSSPSVEGGAYSLYLICRFHSFFVHSYDLSRLTPQEVQVVEQKVAVWDEQLDQDTRDDKKQELLDSELLIKLQKTRDIAGADNHDKWISQGFDNSVNVAKLHEILATQIDGCQFVNVEAALKKHESDETRLLSDVCDFLISDREEHVLLAKLLVEELKCTDQHKRRQIYDDVLYIYFTAHDLDHVNFVKILRIITPQIVCDADCDELATVADEHKMCGKMFMQKDADGNNQDLHEPHQVRHEVQGQVLGVGKEGLRAHL